MASLTEISDANFEEKVGQLSTPVLLDFVADWCVPCKAMEPLLQELAEEYDGRVSFFSINVGENTRTPSLYHVRAVPNLLIIKDGMVLGQLTGGHSKEKIKELVEKAL